MEKCYSIFRGKELIFNFYNIVLELIKKSYSNNIKQISCFFRFSRYKVYDSINTLNPRTILYYVLLYEW